MAFVIPVTEEQYSLIAKICTPLLVISLFSTSTLFTIFTLIRIYYPNLADRVSFRLTFAALFCDIGYSGHILYGLFWDKPSETSDSPCAYATWATVFFTLSSLFFIVCIVCNLHIIFVREYRIRYNFERYYFIISIFLALLISLLPLINNMYGYDTVELSCWYRDSGQLDNIIWQWATLFVWVIAAILYCAFVVTMVIRKLQSATKNGDHLDSSQVSDYPTLINKTLISSVVRRVIWYPLVPLAVQFFNSFAETYTYVHSEVNYKLLLLCDIGLSLQGINVLFLLFEHPLIILVYFSNVLHLRITEYLNIFPRYCCYSCF
ncbi:hypothetical protein C2G38_196190 [Gigaspora rosea]|uniref:G-protein coupled receptors family 2 profile 2 domain-containing protein n=1 Tax=Gigaspora rosea TaxID=44941 RepID=A0A397UMH9_9GLOM|nr:hypothetical protein C2G38_196190 [Gigaspora rosea]